MQIWFGSRLDGCPAPPDSDYQGVGRLVTGPAGLLPLLETRLGLASVPVSELERIAAYQGALDAAGTAADSAQPPFYAASFERDPLAVARRLLQCRDELVWSGWTGGPAEPRDGIPERLRVLVDVEARFQEHAEGRSGQPDRTARLVERLASSPSPGSGLTGIERITVLGRRATLPGLWQRFLEALPGTVPVTDEEGSIGPSGGEPRAAPGTALHAFQAHLLGGTTEEAIDPDETLALFGAGSETTLAHAAAHWLRERGETGTTALVADPARSAPLNRALTQLGAARIPERSRSTARALIQFPVLALRLHAEPFDPQAWLEFLLHPVHPLPGKLRHALARALHDVPGRQNEDWCAALEETLAAAPDPESRKRLEKRAAEWLDPATFEGSRLETARLAETLQRAARWARNRGIRHDGEGETERAGPWLAAASRFRELERLLLRRGDRIERVDLDRFLAAWLGEHAEGRSETGDTGQALSVRDAAHLLTAHDHVLAWQPVGTGAAPSPWHPAEASWLAARGIHLPDRRLILRARQEDALRAALQARDSLALFLPPRNLDRPDQQLPSPLATRILGACRDGVRKDASRLIQYVSLPVIPLRPPRRWWSIGRPERLAVERMESYSSLHKLIYSPYQWVFDYGARLRPGQLWEFRIMDEARRQGGLMHGFVESLLDPEDGAGPDAEALDEAAPVNGVVQVLVRRLLAEGEAELDWESVEREAVQDWVRANWEPLLRKRAAHYLLPGFEATRGRLLHLAENALWALIEQLRAAGVVAARCEQDIAGVPLTGSQQLRGIIDLTVETATGELAVIDLKLGGLTAKRAELKENRHLQLALYGHLTKEAEGKAPHSAYFIFKGNGRLLARSQAIFPGAEVIGSGGADWEDCWADFTQVWSWRRSQIDAGRIEFTVTGAAPDEASEPPHPKWKAGPGADAYNLYDALCGWNGHA